MPSPDDNNLKTQLQALVKQYGIQKVESTLRSLMVSIPEGKDEPVKEFAKAHAAPPPSKKAHAGTATETDKDVANEQGFETTLVDDKGPRDITCHICGRKYHVHSFKIHLPQCERLWKERQALLPKSERKPVPKMPKGVSKVNLAERNETAQKVYNEHALEACPFCSRTFLPESLQKHLPYCARQNNAEWPPPNTVPAVVPIQMLESKNIVVCHICGRKYTTHSIDIHLKQCERLWEQRQELLPPSKRKPVPRMPSNVRSSRRNSVAMKVFQQNTLELCGTCGRSFHPDRLGKHEPSCRRDAERKQARFAPSTRRITSNSPRGI